MVQVNGTKFSIYDLDTIDTFKNRLAMTLGTLPEYLVFNENIDIHNKKNNIIVRDILAEIKQSAKNNDSITNLINTYSKINIQNLISIWFSYNKQLNQQYAKQGDAALQNISDELVKNKIFFTSSGVKREWENREKNKNTLKQRIKNRVNSVQQTLALFKTYKNIEEASVYTPFIIEYVKFILSLNLTDLSLLEVFNAAILTDTEPFITTQNFYKIIKDFVPPSEWSETSEDSLILKILQKKYISSSSNALNYSDAVFKIDPNTKNITTEITIKTGKGNISKEEFTQKTLSVFKSIDMKVQHTTEDKVVGLFYFPSLTLDKYVFTDLVMNNDLFSMLMDIDDHDKATKNKSGLYVHFNHPSTGYITATITEKKMIKNDPKIKEDLELFPVGEPYIRIRVSKADNIKAVQNFQEILGKLFVIYDEKYNDIVELYRKFIPNFGEIQIEEPISEPSLLKHIEVAPDIFITNYSRENCPPDRMTTIISEEEAINLQNKGKSVLKFPRDIPDDPDALRFPNDGENQQYYTCKYEKSQYVGLTENKLENSNEYPYVPCCFKIDQTKKPKFLHYYNGKEIVSDKNIKAQDIIKSNRIAANNQFGVLPVNLDSLFSFIDPNQKYEYLRKGVFRNENSFLNCVMEALNNETGILAIEDENKRNMFLTDQRNELATKTLASLCRQELYDKTTDEIIKIIKDPTVYLDPKLFIHLLEEQFSCNIFLFTRQIIDGEMILPRHLQSYYTNKNQNPCIYIFEHIGSESDHSKYPQCELIVRYNIKQSEEIKDLFTYEDARNIRNIYSKLKKSYALNKVIKEIYFPPLPSSIKIISQWIDSYGKTRKLNISFEKQKISLIISPIPPIAVVETTKSTIYSCSVETAIRLSNILSIQIESQTVIENIIKEINGSFGNIAISIPIIPESSESSSIPNIPEKQYGISFPEQQSSLEKYNRNKKLARYLIEYSLWIYSTYLHNENIEEITDSNIAAFAEKFYTIIPSYDYGYIQKTFSSNSPILQNGKLIVHNEETIKRLVYVIRLSVQQNVASILQYYTKTDIQNYYVDITDFTQHPTQTILFGEESVDKWITENNITYSIHDTIQIGLDTPYFFKNPLIDNNIYLAQNTSTLEKASDISVSWVREKYNVGIRAKNITPVSFTLYSYKNPQNITKIQIKAKPFSEDVKIVGYKINNLPFYTTLLHLS